MCRCRTTDYIKETNVVLQCVTAQDHGGGGDNFSSQSVIQLVLSVDSPTDLFIKKAPQLCETTSRIFEVCEDITSRDEGCNWHRVEN